MAPRYEITPEGKKTMKLDQILLNGNNIAMLVPGGDPEAPTGEAATGVAPPAGADAGDAAPPPPPLP